MPFTAYFRAQQFCSVGFGKQATFKIQPGRQIMIGVRRSGIAIDAAMFAPAIRINRLVERDVGGCVASQDRLWTFCRHLCFERRDSAINLFALVQPVAIGFPRFQVEAGRGGIGWRTAPSHKIRIKAFGHPERVSGQMEQIKNNYCSRNRGISSTKLQGLWRLSNWWTNILVHPSFTAPFEPGSAKMYVPRASTAQARLWMVEVPIVS
jgi:hypothetical protein